MKTRILIALVAALTLIGFSMGTAQAAKPSPPAKYTITVQWDKDVSRVWPKNAINAWEVGTNINFVNGTCSGALCIRVHSWTLGYCANSSIGCADRADIRTEPVHLFFNDGFESSQPRATFSEVLIHEFGHALGLPHSNDPTSIMWYGPSPYHVTKPSASDIANVNALWP